MYPPVQFSPITGPGSPQWNASYTQSTGLTDAEIRQLQAMGIPLTAEGAKFLQEEQAGAAARGGGNPFNGWKLPKQYAGDFWAVYTMAETFAANAGFRYLPNPTQLVQLVAAGVATMDQATAFATIARMEGVSTSMPWAAAGLNQTQYNQTQRNLSDSLYQLTGHTDFGSAGLDPALQERAISQNWTQQQLSDFIQQQPSLRGYGYLKYGYSYNTFQAYKSQNATQLRQRFGNKYTDLNAITAISEPLVPVAAQGGAFGQQTPYVASQAAPVAGRQSAIR